MRIIVIATLALLLTGCVPADPVVTPVPAPSSTPLFATDADALKAAEAAYAAYLKVSDEILADGGADPERIDVVAVREARAGTLRSAKEFQEKGERLVGTSRAANTSLEQYAADAADGRGVVVVYLCVDVSGVDIQLVDGTSVVSPDRPNLQPFEVTFDSSPNTPNAIKVSSEDPWTGESFCH